MLAIVGASPHAWVLPAARPGGRTRTTVMASGLEGDLAGRTFYADKLCAEEEDDGCEVPGDDEFTVAILGDLHLDPRKMEDYYTGRDHFKPILEDALSRGVGTALVSLGDLGESKSVRPEETQELFAGTTECHELAAGFLSSFGVPYEVIGGNHDLEGVRLHIGPPLWPSRFRARVALSRALSATHAPRAPQIDEFATDEANLGAMRRIHNEPTLQFAR